MQRTIVYLIICSYVSRTVVSLAEKESAGITLSHCLIVTSVSQHLHQPYQLES